MHYKLTYTNLLTLCRLLAADLEIVYGKLDALIKLHEGLLKRLKDETAYVLLIQPLKIYLLKDFYYYVLRIDNIDST